MSKRSDVPKTQAEWNALIASHYGAIYAFCCHLTGSPADGADATQETFMKALKSYSTLREEVALKSWLYSIARFTCLDRRRWWRRWSSHFVQTDDSFDPPGENDTQAEVSDEIREALSQLPQRQREVAILRLWHGFSTEETASLLAISTGSVKTHLSRAVHKLQDDLPSPKPQTRHASEEQTYD